MVLLLLLRPQELLHVRLHSAFVPVFQLAEIARDTHLAQFQVGGDFRPFLDGQGDAGRPLLLFWVNFMAHDPLLLLTGRREGNTKI